MGGVHLNVCPFQIISGSFMPKVFKINKTSRPVGSGRESDWAGDKRVGLEMCDMKENHI